MATLHFIAGKPGAGKTTLARELGRALPAIVFCEDEWIWTLGFTVLSLSDYLLASGRCRKMIASLAVELLRQGVSVVFDFAGNTVRDRRWVRSLFESAGARHELHCIDAADADCLENIHRRNLEQPAGIYWGPVADHLFHTAARYFVLPSAAEGFQIVSHAPHSSRAEEPA